MSFPSVRSQFLRIQEHFLKCKTAFFAIISVNRNEPPLWIIDPALLARKKLSRFRQMLSQEKITVVCHGRRPAVDHDLPAVLEHSVKRDQQLFEPPFFRRLSHVINSDALLDPEASHTGAQKVLHASSHFQLLPDILA